MAFKTGHGSLELTATESVKKTHSHAMLLFIEAHQVGPRVSGAVYSAFQ